jgi:hypothetical protein
MASELDKIQKHKEKQKIALLVRRPIFDEVKKCLGEAYVEELITVRSDATYDIFDTTETNTQGSVE